MKTSYDILHHLKLEAKHLGAEEVEILNQIDIDP